MQVIDTSVDSMHTWPMTPRRSVREQVEIFHLLFLRVLTSGADKAHYVVKGGCNLRFWFKSVRYSEDLDLDVTITARDTIKHKVDRILEGVALTAMLRAQGLVVRSASAPKQTETTQRWKLALAAEGSTSTFPTKIEFSRRRSVSAHAFEPVDGAIARRYRVAAPLAHHYLAPAAVAQKIGALAHRTETQARDVFDLHLLFTAIDPTAITLDSATSRDRPRAIERAIDVSFDDYQGQVAAFLEPEQAAIHASRAAWEQMQSDVVSALEVLGR